MNLLAIETSTEFCSLALCAGDAVAAAHFPAGQRHAELILEAIGWLLAEAGLVIGNLDGVAYGKGPGSFTGLRISCGVAQGLALAGGLGVVGVGTLEALAEECGADAAVTCLDARMGEVYHAAYRRRQPAGDVVVAAGLSPVAIRPASGWEPVHAPGLYAPEDVPRISGDGWTGCGSGFAVYGPMLAARCAGNLQAVWPQRVPTGSAVLRLAMPVFAAGAADDAAEALPFYLRDKVALKKGER